MGLSRRLDGIKLKYWNLSLALVLVATLITTFGSIHIVGSTLILVALALHNLWYMTLRHTFRQLNISANHLSEGDLTIQLDSSHQTGSAKIAGAMNRIARDVGRSVTSLNETSEALEQVSQGMFAIADKAQQGAEIQEEQITQAATAINEMSATVNDIASNSQTAADAAKQANESAVHGQDSVKNVVISINSLAEEIGKTRAVIEKLEEDSNNINSIIVTIQEVAEQTNLLALNAAIEAARAGEQGRGFAVVADEVRNLASRTQEATVEIQQRIETLQKGTKSAVQVMENSVAIAVETTEKADGAQQALTDIVTKVDQITEMAEQIATASEQQGSVANEINMNITRVAEVAHDNTIHTGQTSLASNKVMAMAGEIRSLLRWFHVEPVELQADMSRYNVVEWTNKLDVGIDEINRQHQRLVGLVNEVNRLIQENYSLSAIQRVIQALVDYTVTHFRYEENMFDRFEYEHEAEHKAKHQKLVNQVLEFQSRVNAGEDVGEELLDFLKAWLVNHIQGDDMKYGPYLSSHGCH